MKNLIPLLALFAGLAPFAKAGPFGPDAKEEVMEVSKVGSTTESRENFAQAWKAVREKYKLKEGRLVKNSENSDEIKYQYGKVGEVLDSKTVALIVPHIDTKTWSVGSGTIGNGGGVAFRSKTTENWDDVKIIILEFPEGHKLTEGEKVTVKVRQAESVTRAVMGRERTLTRVIASEKEKPEVTTAQDNKESQSAFMKQIEAGETFIVTVNSKVKCPICKGFKTLSSPDPKKMERVPCNNCKKTGEVSVVKIITLTK